MEVTYQTGCRPQESLRLQADYVDLKNARWVFPQQKSEGKKSPRIIYLNDAALAITSRLLEENASEEVACNSRNRPWSAQAVNGGFDRIQIRMGKKVLAEKGESPTPEDVENFINTLSPTKRVKGVERAKRPAELREEAKGKFSQGWQSKSPHATRSTPCGIPGRPTP